MSIESIKVRDLNTTSSIGENDLLLVAKTDGTTQNVKISALSLFIESTVDGLGAVTFSHRNPNGSTPAGATPAPASVTSMELLKVASTSRSTENQYRMKFSFSNGASFTTGLGAYDHGTSMTSPTYW